MILRIDVVRSYWRPMMTKVLRLHQRRVPTTCIRLVVRTSSIATARGFPTKRVVSLLTGHFWVLILCKRIINRFNPTLRLIFQTLQMNRTVMAEHLLLLSFCLFHCLFSRNTSQNLFTYLSLLTFSVFQLLGKENFTHLMYWHCWLDIDPLVVNLMFVSNFQN